MRKKYAVLMVVLVCSIMLVSGFYMIFEKYPVIGTWQYADDAAVITVNFNTGTFSGSYENRFWPDGQYDTYFEGSYMVKDNFIHFTGISQNEPFSLKVEYNKDGNVLTLYWDDAMYAGIPFTRVK